MSRRSSSPSDLDGRVRRRGPAGPDPSLVDRDGDEHLVADSAGAGSFEQLLVARSRGARCGSAPVVGDEPLVLADA